MTDPAPNTVPGTPRWVKLSALAGVVLILLLVAMALYGGGRHGPGRHLPAGGSGAHGPGGGG